MIRNDNDVGIFGGASDLSVGSQSQQMSKVLDLKETDKTSWEGEVKKPGNLFSKSAKQVPEEGGFEVSVTKGPPAFNKRLLGTLQTLRLLSAYHIVAFHFFRETSIPAFNNWAAWGGIQLTFFFMLSGFVLSYQYADRPAIKNTGTFVFRRWSRLYPSYLLSLIIMLFVADWDGKAFFASVFCLTTWISSQFLNVYNTPGWAVGAFLFQYLLFPVVIRPISLASRRYQICVLLPACIGLSMLEAAMASGIELFIYGGIINIFLKPRTASFLFGVVLGTIFLDEEKKKHEVEMAEDSQIPLSFGHNILGPLKALLARVGFTIMFVAFNIFFVFLDITKLPYFLYNWADRGLFMLVFAGIIWLASLEKDCLLGCIFSFRPFVIIGTQASYGVYIFQTSAFTYTQTFLVPALERGGIELAFGYWALILCGILLVFSVLIHNLFEGPISFLLQTVYRKCSKSLKKRADRKQKERDAEWLENLPVDPEAAREAARVGRESSAMSETFKVTLYYICMLGVFSMFAIWTIWRPNRVTNGIVDVEDSENANYAINLIKIFAVIAIPALLFNISGHLLYPPARRVKVPDLEDAIMDEQNCLKARLFFRVVTRGNNPNLVLSNVISVVEVLKNTPLSSSQWVVEVATDNPLYLDERSDVPVTELLVPKDYVCPNGGKYKARALEYAVMISQATRDDWVIHLDEETRIEEETVKYIYAHCAQQEAEVLAGKKEYGNIGQGVILYGTAKYPDNYLTTLADSIRVSDDFGKFRTQYQIGEPLIGMHGSFVVCQTAIEADVSFDHGLAGSITEDAFFALAASGIGVKFSWIDAFMYEQSPFTVLDFIKQRARWFGGLWLVVLGRGLPCSTRMTLAFMTSSWLCSPIVLVAMTLSMLVTTERTAQNTAIIVFVGAASCWGYLLGFVWTFKPSDGWARYAFLFFAQLALQPVFAFMETAGIVYAIIFPPVKGFYIVQKEGGNNHAQAAEADEPGFSSGSSEHSGESGGTSQSSIYLGPADDESTVVEEARKEHRYFVRPDILGGPKKDRSDVELHLREFPEF